MVSNNTVSGLTYAIEGTFRSPYTVLVGASSQILNNKITGRVIAGNYSTIHNNNLIAGNPQSYVPDSEYESIFYELKVGSGCLISYNLIQGITLLHNKVYPFPENISAAIKSASSSIITNNIINGNVVGNPAEISNNIIIGGGQSRDYYTSTQTFPITAVSIGSAWCTFINNSILGTSGSAISACNVSLTSNNIWGNVQAASFSRYIHNYIFGGVAGSTFLNNSITGYVAVGAGGSIQQNNVISFNAINGTITCYSGNTCIIDNTVSGEIYVSLGAASTVIQRNLISDGENEIDVNSPATIQNNTIINHSIGVRLINTSALTISYNNFENNSKNAYMVSPNIVMPPITGGEQLTPMQ
jgi:hypothetical protein